MQPWALLEFAFALAVTVSCFALIIAELHMVERAEEQEFWRQLKEKVVKTE
jgi:hypothetical protein